MEIKIKKIICDDGSTYFYNKLCICSGASPKLIENSEYIIGIRDTETVSTLQHKLRGARQIMIVGNGGIATELVYEIENCKIIWAVRDKHISHVFFDSHAAKFFERKINQNKLDSENKLSNMKRPHFTLTSIFQ